jgi:ABC-type nitrate/sulfonate/bicarbonate transport system substrate-binding protein
MTTRRTLFAGALAGSLMMALMGGTALAQDIETNRLVMGTGIDLPFLVHVVAKEKGWFAEAGFTEVEFRQFSSGNLAGEALLADEIQLWTPGNLPPISMAHNGVPVVILGTNAVSHGLEKLVVREDAGVETPEDLYKIKIGLLLSSTSGAMLGNIATAYGLDFNKLQGVNLAPPEGMAALATNEVQGILYWEPFPYQALQAGGNKLLHTGTVSHFAANDGAEMQVSNNRTVWVASEDWVRRNPKAADALVKVLVETQEYVSDPANRDEVVKIFSDFHSQPVEMNAALLDNYTFDAKVDAAYVEDMDAIAGFLSATNRIGEKRDILSYTYTAPLAKVDAGLVEVEGMWAP